LTEPSGSFRCGIGEAPINSVMASEGGTPVRRAAAA
jgi:hypothetical protein